MTDNKKGNLVLFGGTGGTGQAIAHAATKMGYSLTLFVRDVAKARPLFKDLQEEPVYIEGDAKNAEDVANAFKQSHDLVISSLGIYQRKAGNDDLTRATRNILEAMSIAGPSRFVCISSLGVGDSRGQGDFIVKLIQKINLAHTLADKEQQEILICNGQTDWTIIRPSRLMNGNGPANYLTWTGAQPEKKLKWSVNRSDVAEFALSCAEDSASVGQAYNITGYK